MLYVIKRISTSHLYDSSRDKKCTQDNKKTSRACINRVEADQIGGKALIVRIFHIFYERTQPARRIADANLELWTFLCENVTVVSSLLAIKKSLVSFHQRSGLYM